MRRMQVPRMKSMAGFSPKDVDIAGPDDDYDAINNQTDKNLARKKNQGISQQLISDRKKCRLLTPLVERRFRGKSMKEGKKGAWTKDWETIAFRENYMGSEKPFQVPLKHGGSLRVFVSLLDKYKRASVKAEMLNKVQYRRYPIQGTEEPRVHALYNRLAFSVGHEGSNPLNNHAILSPGYRYGSIVMKSRPLSELPEIYKLADEMAELCSVSDWNIGVETICYRDGNDRMGLHADNAQGEKIIMTVLVESPAHGRTVIVKSTSTLKPDEEIRIILQPSDGYEMDQHMQLVYKHKVPEDFQHTGDNMQRLVIVLRRGNLVHVDKDSGQPVHSLAHRPINIPYNFGPVSGLCGGQIYSRRQLRELKAHSAPQRSVSGNVNFGCDAILVSDKSRLANMEDDCFGYLLFAAENKVGGGCLKTSALKNQRIRVFRKVRKGNKCYRYDGLYSVVAFDMPPHLKSSRTFLFVLKMWNWRGSIMSNLDSSKVEYNSLVHQENVIGLPDFLKFGELVISRCGCYKLNLDDLGNTGVPLSELL